MLGAPKSEVAKSVLAVLVPSLTAPATAYMMNRRPSQAAIHPAPGDRSSRVSRKGSEELKAEDAGIQGLTGKPSMARQTTWQSSTTNWATASKPTDLEELRQRHEMAVEMKRHRWRNYVYSIIASWFEAWASFANRNYMFDPSAQSLLLWDWLIAVLAIYSVTMCPLFVVFPQTRWPGYMSFEIALDALFVTVRRLATRTQRMHLRLFRSPPSLHPSRRTCACAFAPPSYTTAITSPSSARSHPTIYAAG